MKSFKRVDGDYTIELINDTDVLTLDAKTVDIIGNLEVSGNLTYINTEELDVKDPFIVLNSSNTNAYESNSGVLTHKTSSTYAGIRYNDTDGQWEISTSTNSAGTSGTWSALVSGNIQAAGANNQIQYNIGGELAADANFTWFPGSQNLNIDGAVVLQNADSTPGNVANSAVLYADTVGGGGTGLYANNTNGADELVSKTKAIVYGIIF